MKKINHLVDSYAIPFNNLIEAINYMSYSSVERVMFLMLFLTGCRITELDNMRASKLYGCILYWKLGKKSSKHRKISLPGFYLDELKVYRENNRVYQDKLFGVNSYTFRRYFNKNVRPNLSPAWNEERIRHCKDCIKKEFVLQLKGLRKDYQTLEFAKQLKKWKDSHVAMLFTSKQMKHSSEHITAYHYIENFDRLGIKKQWDMTPERIIKEADQRRLIDFY